MPSTFSTSDLTPLLQAAPTATMRYASGVIVSWDIGSFENVIEVRGSLLVNLPVLSGTDALTYKSGDVVSLIGADQQGTRGVASYAILGKFIVPGAGKAEEAIEWMTSELGRAIAAAVLADRVESDTKSNQVTTPGTATWQDGNFSGSPDPGPTVDIEISERGAAIIIANAFIQGQNGAVGRMGFETSGATTRDASWAKSADFSIQDAPPDHVGASVTGVTHFTDLAPGLHKFEAKFWSLNGAGVGPAYSKRSLTVIGF